MIRLATSDEVQAYADYLRKLKDYDTLWDWLDEFTPGDDSRHWVKVRFELDVNHDDEELIFFTDPVVATDNEGNEVTLDVDEMPELSDDGMRDAQLNPDGQGGITYERDDRPTRGKLKLLYVKED